MKVNVQWLMCGAPLHEKGVGVLESKDGSHPGKVFVEGGFGVRGLLGGFERGYTLGRHRCLDLLFLEGNFRVLRDLFCSTVPFGRPLRFGDRLRETWRRLGNAIVYFGDVARNRLLLLHGGRLLLHGGTLGLDRRFSPFVKTAVTPLFQIERTMSVAPAAPPRGVARSKLAAADVFDLSQHVVEYFAEVTLEFVYGVVNVISNLPPCFEHFSSYLAGEAVQVLCGDVFLFGRAGRITRSSWFAQPVFELRKLFTKERGKRRGLGCPRERCGNR